MHGLPSPGLKIAIFSPGSPVRSQIIIQTGSHSRQRIPSALSSSNPGSACSGCRSGAGARSSQDCRGQRQTAATPALRLRLSLHKVRLRRPLRHLFATPYPGTSPAIRRSRSESRVGFCAMASRSARVWGGTPVWIAARTCKPCALRTGKAWPASGRESKEGAKARREPRQRGKAEEKGKEKGKGAENAGKWKILEEIVIKWKRFKKFRYLWPCV